MLLYAFFQHNKFHIFIPHATGEFSKQMRLFHGREMAPQYLRSDIIFSSFWWFLINRNEDYRIKIKILS